MAKQIDLQTIKDKPQTIHDMNKGAKHYVINMTSVELAITILLLGELEVFLAREQDELEEDAQPEPCVDAISREDALFAVRVGMLSTATVYGRSEEGMSARKDIEMALKVLPPVNVPDNNVGEMVSKQVIADIQAEIDDEWYRVKRESIERAEGLELASEIIIKHISGAKMEGDA